MKIGKATRRKSLIIVVVIVAAGILLGAGYYLMKQNSIKEISTINTITNPEKIAEETPKPVAVRLPNADPIYDVQLEYFAPDGIWFLVNKTAPLPDQSYYPSDLVKPNMPLQPDKTDAEMSVREVAREPLESMAAAAKNDGIDLMVGSGFRSYELQNFYYSNIVRASGEAEANRVSARPGTSEHQLGLAVDFTTPAQTCRLQACFETTPAGQWLAEHAAEYGFILRYPKNGESVTGYIYEPWHFRYVGKEFATAFKRSGLATYEEAYRYLEQAKKRIGKQRNYEVTSTASPKTERTFSMRLSTVSLK